MNDDDNFRRDDIILIELGHRVYYALYFENTGTTYNRLLAIKPWWHND